MVRELIYFSAFAVILSPMALADIVSTPQAIRVQVDKGAYLRGPVVMRDGKGKIVLSLPAASTIKVSASH